MEKEKWSEDEEILALALYYKTPFGKISKRNPDIVKLAGMLKRSPNSVGMKMCNFARFDPYLQKRGISGLQNGAALDEKIWNRYADNPVKLYSDAEAVAAKYRMKIEDILSIAAESAAAEKNVNPCFKYAVLSAYDNTCCITGIDIPVLLHAVYINPSNVNPVNVKERQINPSNGLCLNALHGEAFENGIITIDEAYKIAVSKQAKSRYSAESFLYYFEKYDGRQISLPRQFLPDKEMLLYHNEHIFIA